MSKVPPPPFFGEPEKPEEPKKSVTVPLFVRVAIASGILIIGCYIGYLVLENLL